MLKKLLRRLEDSERPLLGPHIKSLKFWGLLLPKNTLKKNFYIAIHVFVYIFIATECMEIWDLRDDITLVINNVKITIQSVLTAAKTITFLIWQKKWISVIEYITRADLIQRNTEDVVKKNIITKYTKYCRKFTYLFCCLMFTTDCIVIFTPVFKYFLSATYRDNVKNGTDVYTPVVSSWVPFDKSTLPGYLAASAYQTYATVVAFGWITSFDTTSMVVMAFFKGELEMLRRDSSNIFGTMNQSVTDNEAKDKLKDCHNRHLELVKFARIFDSCLSPIMLLYMIICSVMLCVTAYQITSETNVLQSILIAEYLVFSITQLFIYCWHSNEVLYTSETNVLQSILIAEYFVFSITQLFIYCWHSNEVLYTSQDLMLGPFESIWWSTDVKKRKDLCILVAQFREVIVFNAGPFVQLTVASFINILKGAYSYYTLLTQSQMK